MHAQKAEALALKLSEKEASLSDLRIESGMLEGRIEELLAAQAKLEVVYEEVENMENLVSGIIDAVVNVPASYSCMPAYAVTSDFPGDTSSHTDDFFVNSTGETGTVNFGDSSELVVPSWESDIDAPAPNAPRTLLATAFAPNSPLTPLATAGARLPTSPVNSPIPYLTGTPVHWNNPVTPSTQTPAPRRTLIGLSPRTPACVFGGRAKARVTQSTRKILAEKENVLPSLL
ncbi:hypothetical protein DFH11DRAFT_1637235 [Phellopilus nigrolimitatus]|nr:hypothetical protein DFH11DRAFT_1637235 [Phellopilus nigrolimitatus]